MSSRSCGVLVACAAALIGAAAAQDSPNLGVEATAEDIAGWDISIAPDGDGLPPGSGTPAAGAQVYSLKCATCHGPQGEGLLNDRLAGGQGTLDTSAAIRTTGSYWPYATTIFDYVRRAMPYLQPHSLTGDEAYALTAHLLHLNGVIDADEVMNSESLPRVEMPNRDNFIRAYPSAE
jgi:cytochrome c